MLGKMKDVQAKLMEAQENLVNVQHTSESGGGMVKATVNGKKQIVELEIDDELFNPDDKDMLKDLVIAAVNKALEEVEEKSKEELRKSTEGMLPNIPGMNFGNM